MADGSTMTTTSQKTKTSPTAKTNTATRSNTATRTATSKPSTTSKTSATAKPSSSALTPGAKAGIAVGVLLGLALLAIGIFFLDRRRRQKRRAEAAALPQDSDEGTLAKQAIAAPVGTLNELPAESRTELGGTAVEQTHELDSTAVKGEKGNATNADGLPPIEAESFQHEHAPEQGEVER